MLAIKGVDHINMNVSNLENSIKFYKKLFQNTEIKEEGESMRGNPYKIISLDGRLFLCLYENLSSTQSDKVMNHFGIHIQNFNETVQVLKQEDIPLLYGGIVDYPNSKSVYIADPDGNEIELSSEFGGGL